MTKEINVGPGGYSTIREAIDAASDFDIIRVFPGVYNEVVTINKILTILGAAAGISPQLKASRPMNETVIKSTSPIGSLQLMAPNIVVDGLVIEGNTEGPGIYTSIEFSGYCILNNIIQGNTFGLHLNTSGEVYSLIKQNYFHKNNQPGLISGSGIFVDENSSNIHICNNLFTEHQPAASINLSGKTPEEGPSNVLVSNNEMISDNSILLTNTNNVVISQNKMTNTLGSSIFIGGGTNKTIIENNTLSNSLTNGIYINDFFSGIPNQNIKIINNSIIGNQTAALNITANAYSCNSPEFKLQACLNWWQSPKGPAATGESNSLLDPEEIVKFRPYLNSAPASNSNSGKGIQPALRINSNANTTIVADSKEIAVLSQIGLSNEGQRPIVVNNLPKTWPELRDYQTPNNSILLGEPEFIWQQLDPIGGEMKYFSTKYNFSKVGEHLIFITSFADNSHRLFVEERNSKTGELIRSITPKEGLAAGNMLANAGLSIDTEPPYNWQRICQYSNIFTPASADNVILITFEVINYLSQCKFNPAALAFRVDILKLE